MVEPWDRLNIKALSKYNVVELKPFGIYRCQKTLELGREIMK